MSDSKLIMHVDMDMFFAAVEIRENPELKGKPIVVGGPTDKRGVVACASYPARKFGIHAGMPNVKAAGLCSRLIFVSPNFDLYMEASEQVYQVLQNFSPFVEMFSIDEAFLDMTGCRRLWGKPLNMVRLVKSAIYKKTHLTCSVGMAPTKYLSKYAAGINKPNGHFIISAERVKAIIPTIPVHKISGVGPKFKTVLNRLGIRYLGDVLKYSEEYWSSRLGKLGYWLYNVAKGKQLSPIEPVSVPKSMGNEFTLAQDTDDPNEIKTHLLFLSEKVSWRLRNSGFKARTICLKLRDSSFFTSSIQRTLPEPTNLSGTIYQSVLNLLPSINLKVKKIRLLGISTGNLVPVDLGSQLTLFNYQDRIKKTKLAAAKDKLWKKYGKFSVKPAKLL